MVVIVYRKKQEKGTGKQYGKGKFDILTDYEELCGRLKDILTVLGMTSVGENSEKTATINVVSQALESLIIEHTKNTNKYREDIA